MKQQRNLVLALTLCALFSLTACTRRAQSRRREPAETQQPVVVSAEGQWLDRGGCYKLDRLSQDEYLWMKGGPEHLVFAPMTLDRLTSREGSILLNLPNGYIKDCAVAEDGIWYVREKGLVNGQYINDSYAVRLGFDGQEFGRFDVSVLADSLAVVPGAVYIYDAVNQKLAVYGADGAELGRIDLGGAQLEDFSGRLCTGGDGSVWLLSTLESGQLLYPVELSTMRLGSAITLPEGAVALSAGTAEHPFLLATQRELAYLDPASGDVSNILYWDECGLFSGELSCFTPDGDGFLCLSVTGLSRLSPAQPGEIHSRTRLTLGAQSAFDVRDLAALFNAQSSDYYVEVVDYSNGGELSREDAMLRLNTEVLSGGGPDIIMVCEPDALRSAAAFADLYPLLDADPELSREDFYGLGALETGGRLLLAPSHLGISTFGACPSVLGQRSGWTWDEYFDMESRLPAGGAMYSYLSAEFFLRTSLELYAPHAIDWVNGTCSFDTPEFVRILEAAKKGYDPDCPAENPYFLPEINARMADGRQILVEAGFFDTDSFARNEQMYGPLNYIGWPTPDGSCGSVFNVHGVCVNAAAGNMDGCWEFTKYVLKSTYVYKPAFEAAIAKATASGSAAGGQELPLTQDQAQRYRKLLESITVAASDNSTISGIVLQEAAAMFAGSQSPQDTARLIQSKLSIYVAEHR